MDKTVNPTDVLYIDELLRENYCKTGPFRSLTQNKRPDNLTKCERDNAY